MSRQPIKRWRASPIDLYAVLNVEHTASFADIRSAYKRAALLTHPDKGGTSDAFLKVAVAFETLSHERLRAAYDRRRQPVARASFANAVMTGNASFGPPADQVNDSAHRSSTPRCNRSVGQRKSATQSEEASKNLASSKPSGVGSASSSATKLQHALQCLCAALQALTAEQRRSVLEDFDAIVRTKLYEFMSQQKTSPVEPHQVVCVPLKRDCPSDFCQEDSDDTSDASSSSSSEPLIYSIEDAFDCSGNDLHNSGELDANASAEPGGTPTPTRGVETMKQPNMKGSLYRAAVSFSALRFYTKYTQDLGTAIEHHITLALMRHAAMGSRQRDKYAVVDSTIIKQACSSVLVERGVTASDLGLKVVFRLLLLHRRSCGRHLYLSSPCLPVDEALSWRTRMINAKRTGWAEFRVAWIELLQHPKARRKVSLESAVAHVDTEWPFLAPHWQRNQARWANATQRKDAMHRARAERRVQRFARRVKRIMEEERVSARRTAAKALRERRREQRQLSQAKWRWLRRQDLTVEEMLRGPPANI